MKTTTPEREYRDSRNKSGGRLTLWMGFPKGEQNGIIQLHRLGIRRSECGAVVVGMNKSLHGQLKDADKYIQNAVPDKWEDEESYPYGQCAECGGRIWADKVGIPWCQGCGVTLKEVGEVME